jgi:hypothetical protein
MKNRTKDNDGLARITTEISPLAVARIKQECARQYTSNNGNVRMGKVISDLVMKYLPPHAAERQGPKVATRSREAAA